MRDSNAVERGGAVIEQGESQFGVVDAQGSGRFLVEGIDSDSKMVPIPHRQADRGVMFVI